MGFSIQTGAMIEAAKKLRDAKREEQRAAFDSVANAALIMDRDLKETALNGGRPVRRGLFMESRPGFRLGTRSGVTAASVTTLIARRGSQIIASVGTSLKHVLWNEEGATVTPRSGRALVIPTVNALTPAGTLKNLFAGLGSLRNAFGRAGRRLFVFRSKSGAAWLAAREGSAAGTVVRNAKTGRFQQGGRLVLYFLLVARAEIPARYMFRHAKRRVEPLVVDDAGNRMGVAITKALA